VRKISPRLTPELETHIGSADVGTADTYAVDTYRGLVHHIARLATLNKDFMFLYRGQGRDYVSKSGRTSLYPSIYRGGRLTSSALDGLYSNLERTSKTLRSLIQAAGLEGQEDASKRLVLWSLLQHYEVCSTPLLDFTSSVRVACSFALHNVHGDSAYVYVCAFPYTRGRISVDSEHDLVTVRLLGICPPDALRPVFQEGYLAETYEITTDYPSKDLLDFNRRLVAKFRIPVSAGFWEDVASIIPREELYPANDPLLEIAEEVTKTKSTGDVIGPIGASEIGRFLERWARLERAVLSLAGLYGEVPRSLGEALSMLAEHGVPGGLVRQLDAVRRIRNRAVHSADDLLLDELRGVTLEIPYLVEAIDQMYMQVSADLNSGETQ